MIEPDLFVDSLKHRQLLNYTGVPCSFFKGAINRVLSDGDLSYTMVPNEGAALALAAGNYLAGKISVLMIQNSGLANLLNPLTSLHMIYRIPALIFVSGRAYGVDDEPQHEIIGRAMPDLLSALELSWSDMPSKMNDWEKALELALQTLKTTGMPYFFLVRKGTIRDTDAQKIPPSPYKLTRMQAIRMIAERVPESAGIVATTGKPSRELFAACDRPGNFYMQGSMGHAPAIALGLALSEPSRKVLILDGDGALLMHLGILSSIGYYSPPNLYHILLDNGAYETTGNQDTTASRTDFSAIARACGYAGAADAETPAALNEKLAAFFNTEGPRFLRIRINREPCRGIPRITTRYKAFEISDRVRDFYRGE